MDNEKYKILLVDDEPDVLEFLSYNLKREGYRVFTGTDGREAITLARQLKPHLIILDVMMPNVDGIAACAEIRKLKGMASTIIIFLTARGEEYNQIAGFNAGSDDYITKPIKPKILISRVKALLRRYRDEEETDKRISISGIVIDRECYVVEKENQTITLPKKEFELLSLLVSKPNKVFTREEIFEQVWGTNVIVGDRTIDVHIRKIREKLNIANIKTVKGVGYKFES
ncbi:MAG: DNA-binding response regulator [Bacteroidetes bacterium]|nr:MAG: DNA-binding response regulator [Bacteroidota bacterium]PIE88676.1 MAG: DNA-binding response regulator [Bacteroidota bacterium]